MAAKENTVEEEGASEEMGTSSGDEGGEGGLFGPDDEEERGLIARSSWGWLIKAGGMFALLIGCFSLFMVIGPENGREQALFNAVLFLSIAFVALVLRSDKEIRLDKENGTIELREKRLFFKQTTRKCLISQISHVFYQASRRAGRTYQPAWIRFTFRDGTKFDCDVRGSYVPGQHEFAGAKVDYNYGR